MVPSLSVCPSAHWPYRLLFQKLPQAGSAQRKCWPSVPKPQGARGWTALLVQASTCVHTTDVGAQCEVVSPATWGPGNWPWGALADQLLSLQDTASLRPLGLPGHLPERTCTSFLSQSISAASPTAFLPPPFARSSGWACLEGLQVSHAGPLRVWLLIPSNPRLAGSCGMQEVKTNYLDSNPDSAADCFSNLR